MRRVQARAGRSGVALLLSVLVGGVYPTFVQRIQVEPNELNVERPYVQRHLEATRSAFDLDAAESKGQAA